MPRCLCNSGKTSDTRKKLIKHMVSESTENPSNAALPLDQEVGDEARCKVERQSTLTEVVLALLKKLDRDNLDALATAVEWGNAGDTTCALLDLGKASSSCEDTGTSPLLHADRGFSCVIHCGKYSLINPIFTTCKAWRWGDLDAKEPVKSLSFCRWACQWERNQRFNDTTVCINPYHWSRLALNESSVHRHPRVVEVMDKMQCCKGDMLPGRNSSLSDLDIQLSGPSDTSLYSADGPLSCGSWCMLSYWEMLHHLKNSWLPVTTDTYHVFASLHTGDGLCLTDLVSGPAAASTTSAALCGACGGGLQVPAGRNIFSTAATSASDRRQIHRCREKIGSGLTIMRFLRHDGFEVWVYNRSDIPLFLSSPTLLSRPEEWELPRVQRLQPGHSICVFDSTVFDALEALSRGSKCVETGRHLLRPGETMNRRVIHVSFGKGWGSNYRRQDVTSCPCRLEVVISPHTSSLPE